MSNPNYKQHILIALHEGYQGRTSELADQLGCSRTFATNVRTFYYRLTPEDRQEAYERAKRIIAGRPVDLKHARNYFWEKTCIMMHRHPGTDVSHLVTALKSTPSTIRKYLTRWRKLSKEEQDEAYKRAVDVLDIQGIQFPEPKKKRIIPEPEEPTSLDGMHTPNNFMKYRKNRMWISHY